MSLDLPGALEPVPGQPWPPVSLPLGIQLQGMSQQPLRGLQGEGAPAAHGEASPINPPSLVILPLPHTLRHLPSKLLAPKYFSQGWF